MCEVFGNVLAGLEAGGGAGGVVKGLGVEPGRNPAPAGDAIDGAAVAAAGKTRPGQRQCGEDGREALGALEGIAGGRIRRLQPDTDLARHAPHHEGDALA